MCGWQTPSYLCPKRPRRQLPEGKEWLQPPETARGWGLGAATLGLPRSRDGRFSWSLFHWELRLPHVTCDNGEDLDCGFKGQLCCDPRQMI